MLESPGDLLILREDLQPRGDVPVPVPPAGLAGHVSRKQRSSFLFLFKVSSDGAAPANPPASSRH